MATPHVAGLAAILKQEHPDWDGEQLKSAIANSTVPVADATGFDAGTGRVDALDAIHQDVLAPASLSLGSYAWPYSDLEPTRTALTYTNTGDAAVTLALALTGQDGSAEPTGSMTLPTDQVTVPAGGTSSVDVVLDPTVADPGAYSAVVTATPDDGGGTVRTGLAYLLEPERVRRQGHDQAARRLAERLAPARPERLRRAVDLRAALVRRLTRRAERDLPAAARHLRHRRDLLRPGR